MRNVLASIYNAFDPLTPASDAYYEDCTRVRGVSSLREQFIRYVSRTNDYRWFLFTGQAGCGLSSELVQLARELDRTTPYFPVMIGANDYLDTWDANASDLLLAVLTEATARLHRDLAIDLRENLYRTSWNELRAFLLPHIEIGQGEIGSEESREAVRRLRLDPAARLRLRGLLEPRLPGLLQMINEVLDDGRLQLRKSGQSYADFVLIIDDVEKIRGADVSPLGVGAERSLLVDGASLLTGIRAHVVCTVPLHLARSQGVLLQQRYGTMPFVLPAVKLFERGTHSPYSEGRDCLRSLLQKRLGDRPLDHAFESDALEFLLTYSGGHLRTLIALVRETCISADALPFSLSAVQQAIRPMVQRYSSSITEAQWGKLAALDRTGDQIPSSEPVYLALLDNLGILGYMEGEGADPFSAAEPWYAVNPIVRELRKFKEAAYALSDR